MNQPFDSDQSLDETTFAVFDVETTGLNPTYGHRICEVACLRVRGGVALDCFESLVDPRRPISPGAFSVNGITPRRATVSSGKYPIARPLFMFTNGYPKLGTHVHAMVTLHLTEKGQEIVEAIGYVPVTNY